MWVEETKNGYRLVERYKDPLTNKTRRASVKLEKNTKQAINKARLKLMNKIESNLDTSILYDDVTLDELVEEYKKIKFPTLKKQTQRNVENYILTLKKVLNFNVLVKNIDTRTLNLAFNELGNDYRLTSLKTIKKTTATIFEYAVDNKIIDRNPAKKVILSSKVEPKKRIKFLEKEDVKEVIELVYDTNSFEKAVLTELLLYTGLRIGEAFSLTWDKVDLENKILIVDGEVKTESSKRKVSLTDNVITSLQQLKKINDNDKVFNFSETGYRAFLTKLNFDKHLYPHLFRHTHISILAELGVNIKAIMKRVGHSDSKTTLDIYTHVTEKMEEKVIDKLNNYL